MPKMLSLQFGMEKPWRSKYLWRKGQSNEDYSCGNGVMPVEQGSVTFNAAAVATAASAAVPPCWRILIPACMSMASLFVEIGDTITILCLILPDEISIINMIIYGFDVVADTPGLASGPTSLLQLQEAVNRRPFPVFQERQTAAIRMP